MMHVISQMLDVAEHIAAKQRSASTVNGPGIDLSQYQGGLCFQISAGAFGAAATLDAKLQESDDNAAFTDVAGLAMTQMTAVGTAKLEASVRKFKKRYIRLSATSAVQTVDYGVTFIGQKTKI